jgi:hypothetical protein
MDSWDLLVDRTDLARTDLLDRVLPDPGQDEVILRVDRVGVTANNVTYALAGDALNYWDFFPAENGWGRVPLWGFADVVASGIPSIEVGTRVYGYLPTSSHLIVRPVRQTDAGFRDGSEHRANLPGTYNLYAVTTSDPSYDADREELQILYRPLFVTSFMLDDFLGDNDFFGADRIVVSSASSKTAYGTAFCMGLRDSRPRLVALTSARNVDFTSGLGCYDEVVSYDDVTSMPATGSTLYLDFAGSIPLRATIHEHYGENLVYDAVAGATHLDPLPEGSVDISGPAPALFFAPDQIAKRKEDWGPGQIEKRYGVVWRSFVPAVEKWVDVIESKGPEGLRAAWLEVLAGRPDPRMGHVVTL